jgi:hypothetical protein
MDVDSSGANKRKGSADLQRQLAKLKDCDCASEPWLSRRAAILTPLCGSPIVNRTNAPTRTQMFENVVFGWNPVHFGLQ